VETEEEGRRERGGRTIKRRNWARKRSAAPPPPLEPVSQRPRELMRESTLWTLSSSRSASIAAFNTPPEFTNPWRKKRGGELIKRKRSRG
jgi:hypothetical protein